ncbi:MAG: hypothetical protein N3A69_01685 [Leptospiraceae bacterium]|nr:hypothetical protein [Leptospiraceae bacterium]
MFFKKAFFFLFVFIFSNCFEIVHYVQKLENDKFQIQWSFTISSAFTKQDPNQPAPPKENLKEKLKSSEAEFNQKLKGYVDSLSYNMIDTEYETGVKVSFNIKDINQVPKMEKLDEEGLPMLPRWRKDKNQLIFRFLNKDKSQEQENVTSSESPEEGQVKPEESGDPTQKIVSMIMSSATYRLILGNNLYPRKVFVQGMSNKKTHYLETTDYGGQTHIRIPFMTLLNEDKKGFFLVVQL